MVLPGLLLAAGSVKVVLLTELIKQHLRSFGPQPCKQHGFEHPTCGGADHAPAQCLASQVRCTLIIIRPTAQELLNYFLTVLLSERGGMGQPPNH